MIQSFGININSSNINKDGPVLGYGILVWSSYEKSRTFPLITSRLAAQKHHSGPLDEDDST
jgi:hypothetical protein